MNSDEVIVHNLTDVGQASLGLGQVALNLASEQSAQHRSVQVWCACQPADVEWAYSSTQLARGSIVRFRPLGPGRLGYAPSMTKTARMRRSEVALVHQHGIWTFASHVTRTFRRRHGIPTVVAPHGSLQGWALGRSKARKLAAWLAYERGNLRGASCLHATGQSEIADFRDFGLRNPIALVPNGVPDSWLNSTGDGDRFRQAHGIGRDRRMLLFLSRITPKKGLLLLIRAIFALRTDAAAWLLVIAGVDEFDHKREVEGLIAELGVEQHVKVMGPLFGQPKRDAFDAAELFVLPSQSEGSPVVVLDSLGAGVPVITTKAAPWGDLTAHNCGWWIDFSEDALVETLREALALSSSDLSGMGERGRDLVANKYRWRECARRMLQVYDWLLGRSDAPDHVCLR